MLEIQAPNNFDLCDPIMCYWPKVFLAGSIEMGTAERWQDRVIAELKDYDVILLNPRRTDWDWTWEQSKDNAKFKEQVRWELMAQTEAEYNIFYFDPKAKSPITLLELGMFKDKNPIVCCPEGFWRKGNVDIVCDWFKITQVNTLEDLIFVLKSCLRKSKNEHKTN